MTTSNHRRLRAAVAALLLGTCTPAMAQQAAPSAPVEETNRYPM